MKIQEFSFGNFKSFKDIQTLSLATSKLKSRFDEIEENNVIHGKNNEGISFLKSKVIYGANASGKSNIVKALIRFIRIVKTSVKDDSVLDFIDSFRLSTETENQPTFFQIIVWDKNVKYRYGFEATDEKITSEWLFGKPGEREMPYFIRENNKIIELDKTNFSEGDKLISLIDDDSENNSVFRHNSLFLSTLATFGFGKLSKQIVDGIASIIVIHGLGHQGMYKFAGDSLKDKQRKKYIVNFLKYGDIGIEDIDNVEISPDDLPEDVEEDIKKEFNKKERKRLVLSSRKKFNEDNDFVENESFVFGMNESEGTIKMFELSPFIYEAIVENRTIVIDEFDARLHPLLTQKILELFNSKANKGSQLIVPTHDTNLLSPKILRRDQIEFVEKDKYGASYLYSLAEFKGIRNDASFEKDYFQGKYGAVPFLGNFNKLKKMLEDA
jgi:AAA15 family ATPase/GTPase